MSESPSSIPTSASRPYAKPPRYLHRRGQRYYFKRKIPADMRHLFSGTGEQYWKALGTTLLEKARVLLAVEVSEFDFAVAKHRRANAARAAGVQVKPLEAPSQAGTPSSGSTIAPSAELQPYFDLLRTIEQRLLNIGTAGAGGADAPTPPGLQKFGQGGSLGDTPKLPVRKAPKRAQAQATVVERGPRRPNLVNLFEHWKRKQTRHRTINAVQMAVHEFRDAHGSLPVEAITRQNVREYRDLLVERGLAKGTIENRIGFLSTLVRYGMLEIVEDLAKNPFERIEITGGVGKRPKKDRRAYEISELNTLFASPLYCGDYEPKGQVVEAAHWLPILGPYFGARIEELSQLRVSDIQRINGVWCARLCDLGEDQKLKNDGSFRRVPLHENVIKCGFLVHVARMAKAGHERIFPSLSNVNSNGIFSNAAGKWYGRYMSSIGLTDHRLDYHSFRYSFRQQCSLCGIQDEVKDALTGHWVGKSDGGRTYMRGENNQYPYPALVDAVKKLKYDELRIAHLFVDEPMKGVEDALIR